MEIHKPKPVHSLRDFLGEIIVIVIGIVIALTGEQLIEARHRDHERAELRLALDRDSREAIIDANRTVQFSDQFIASLSARMAEIRQAQNTHTPLPQSKPIHTQGFDIAVDPAFRAASTSGLLALLPQDEVLAYAEADQIATEIGKAYETFRQDSYRLRAFDYNFRNPSGQLEMSAATPAQLAEYTTHLNTLMWSIDNLRYWNQEFAGVEQSLLKGNRSLDALHNAERASLNKIQALDTAGYY